MTWPLPDNVGQWELWSQVVAVWMAVNYLSGTPVGRQAMSAMTDGASRSLVRRFAGRALIGAIVAYALPGLTLCCTWPRLSLAVAVAATTLVLGAGRIKLSRSERLSAFAAEWEILLNLVAIGAIGSLIGTFKMVVVSPALVFPISQGRSAALFSCLAAGIVVVGGGTHIVRGVLDKVQALPPSDPGQGAGAAEGVDVREYNRGRAIGNIERLMMLTMIAVGSYEALAFLIAAKGLIRAKEFEDRAFAEYFIVGSLTSAAVALAVAIPLNVIIKSLWGN